MATGSVGPTGPALGLALFAACLACLVPESSAAERRVDLELVLAADISESMDIEEAALQRRGFAQALRHPAVIEAIRSGPLGRIAITYREWAGADVQLTLVDWTEVGDAESAAALAEAIELAPLRTARYTSIGTTLLRSALDFEDNGFTSRRRVIDISGDGPNNQGIYVVAARDAVLARGIVINGLPIISGRPNNFGYPTLPDLDLYYEDCVIGGFGSFLVVADGFKDFARAIRRKMVLEIAGRTPPRRLLWRVAERPRPPCDIGERLHRAWIMDFN